MLLMSFVLCIASVLITTFKRQWAHKYIWLPQVGILLSVLLFVASLVLPFFMINMKVAIVVSTTIGLIVIVYLMLTILTFVDRIFKYRTPLSSVWWSRRERQGYI